MVQFQQTKGHCGAWYSADQPNQRKERFGGKLLHSLQALLLVQIRRSFISSRGSVTRASYFVQKTLTKLYTHSSWSIQWIEREFSNRFWLIKLTWTKLNVKASDLWSIIPFPEALARCKLNRLDRSSGRHCYLKRQIVYLRALKAREISFENAFVSCSLVSIWFLAILELLLLLLGSLVIYVLFHSISQ